MYGNRSLCLLIASISVFSTLAAADCAASCAQTGVRLRPQQSSIGIVRARDANDCANTCLGLCSCESFAFTRQSQECRFFDRSLKDQGWTLRRNGRELAGDRSCLVERCKLNVITRTVTTTYTAPASTLTLAQNTAVLSCTASGATTTITQTGSTITLLASTLTLAQDTLTLLPTTVTQPGSTRTVSSISITTLTQAAQVVTETVTITKDSTLTSDLTQAPQTVTVTSISTEELQPQTLTVTSISTDDSTITVTPPSQTLTVTSTVTEDLTSDITITQSAQVVTVTSAVPQISTLTVTATPSPQISTVTITLSNGGACWSTGSTGTASATGSSSRSSISLSASSTSASSTTSSSTQTVCNGPPTSVNAIQNPGFESGLSPWYTVGTPGMTVVDTTDRAYSGSASVSMSTKMSLNQFGSLSFIYATLEQTVYTVPGVTYVFSYNYKPLSTEGGLGCGVNINCNGRSCASNAYSYYTTSSAQWLANSFSFTPTSNITTIQVMPGCGFGGGTQKVLLDNFALTGLLNCAQASCSIKQESAIVNGGFDDNLSGTPWNLVNGVSIGSGGYNNTPNAAALTSYFQRESTPDETTALLTQTLTGLITGSTYNLAYYYNVPNFVIFGSGGQCDLTSLIDGKQILNSAFVGESSTLAQGSNGWALTQGSFTASKASQVLSFQWDCPQSGDTLTAKLDDVTVIGNAAICTATMS